MRTDLRFIVHFQKLFLLLFLFSFTRGFGQQSIVTPNSAVTQNFTIGTSATASLPTGFKTGTDWATGTTATTQAAGTSGAGILNGTSTGGFYNFANGVTASSTDRAIGFLTSGGFTSPRSIIYAFTNNTGSTVTSLSLSWDYEKYRSGTRAFAWTFFHGNTSTATTAAASGDQAYAADANNTVVFNPPTTISKSFSITGLSIANGSTYYLRWTYTGSGGSTNAQGIGIDNFSITLNVPPTITLTDVGFIGATNITPNSTDNIIAHFQANVSVANATLNSLQFATTTGGANYLATDLGSPFKLYYSTSSTYGSGSVISTVASGAPGTFTFTGLTQVINSGTTGYFWILVDASSSSGGNRFLSFNANPTLTFASGTPTGSIIAQGFHTFITPATPFISVTGSLSSFGTVCVGSNSAEQTYQVSGGNLTANLIITPPAGFQISLTSGSGFVSNPSTLSLVPSSGTVAATTIYVRYSPSSGGAASGNITHTSTGASTINQACSGTGDAGTPSVTTTAASSILTTTASSGGTAISTTCATTISAKGVVWGLAANPTIPSVNSTNDGTGTANYTSSITGLTAGTTYNYRAYATNNNGVTSYGTNLTFTTLSLEPLAHAASFTVTAPTSSSLTLNFSAANTITNAAGYLILMRAGAAPTGSPSDANGYSVGNSIGDGTVAAIITNTATTSTVVTGLSGSTTYHFLLFPYGYNGSASASYNYLTAPTVPLANGTTTYSSVPAGGDIAFTSFQSSAPDGIEFITLRRLDLRNAVLTDNGILSTNAMRSGEGNYTIPNTTAFSDIPAGTILRFDENTGTNDQSDVDGVMHIYGSGSNVAGVSNFNISTSGDQAILYTGSAATPSFVAGITGSDAVANWNTGATSTNDSKAPGTSSDFYMGTPDNGLYSGTVTGNAGTIRTSIVNAANWTTSGSAQPTRFNNKNILFNESNYSSGTLFFSSVTATSFSIDASGINFSGETANTTRYAVVIRASAAPSNPTDRFTCYTGTLNDNTANIGTDPTVMASATDVCTGTTGNGTVVYIGYNKPSALVVNGLSNGITYYVSVYALNGNGWSANYSSTPVTATQTTVTLTPDIALSSPSQVGAANVQPGINNHIISHFQAAVSTSNATLSSLSFTTTGSYTATELTGNFTLWYGTTSVFGSASSIATVASAGPGTFNFTGLLQAINSGTTGYFWITCNTNASAVTPRTIQVSANPTLTFVLANITGSISAGGVQTITPVIPTVLTNASVTAITENSASSGGDATSAGGGSISARGVVWNTTSSPVLPGLGSTTDGSGTGTFSSSLTSLNPQTLYFVRAYATNTAGSGYGSDVSFYTLSNPPNLQAGTFLGNPFSSTQIDLSWDAAGFPASGATVKGYILARATDPVLPVFSATNGNAPTVSSGVIVSSTIAELATTFSNTGLGPNTTYNYLLIPFCWDGVHPETYHYLTAGAQTVTVTTPPGSCTSPSVQPSSVGFVGVTASQMTVNFAAGNGTNRLVIVRAGSAVTASPVIGTAYTASSTFGGGDNLGSFQYVVYNGSSTSFTLTGLSPSTTYHFAFYEFNSAGNCYLLTSPAAASQATPSAPSIIETFEPGTKITYANGSAVCNLGLWGFNDALIGATGSDKKNGAKAARIQNSGAVFMLFDKPNGLGTVIINHARYGVDAVSTWRMEVSDNGGATYTAFVSSVFTAPVSLTPQSIAVNIPGDIRIRITKLSGGTARLNLDDISMTDFVPTNTISTTAISGSPFCISNSSGISVNVPFTSTGTYNSLNVYTAQLSDATGSFSIPTDIGTLASSANAGTISATIPAGTATGLNYRIRVIASDPPVSLVNVTQNPNALAIYLNAPDVSTFFANAGNAQVTLGWTNPAACFDEILVVAKAATPVTANPSGNGSLYTANSVFSTGGSGANLPANEYAVFKNTTGTGLTVTGLTNGTLYYFEIFTRKGTLWSDGVIVASTPDVPQVGDFQTRPAVTANWNGTATWQTWNGSSWVNTTSFPNGTGVSVRITSGCVITVSTSHASQPIKNLIVDAGGKLFTNSTTLNGNRYLTVYGSIVCNGEIGNGASTYDNISFNIEGNPTVISGIGNFNACRIRKNYNVNATTNLIIAMNMGLRFASSSGSSGTVLYNNYSGNTTFNVTLNENSILSVKKDVGLSGNVSIDGIDGEGGGERGGLFTINGILNIEGTLFAFTDNLIAACGLTIGTSGQVNCVNVCTGNTTSAQPDGSEAGGFTLRILNGGRLNMTDNAPFNKRTNNTSPYTYASGLGSVNQVYDFQPGSIVEYSSIAGTQPVQSTGLIYSNIVFSGGAIKEINSTLTVNRDLTIISPAVFNINAQQVNLGGDWNNYGSIGFDEGTAGKINFNGTAVQRVTCPGGEDFYNVDINNASASGVILDCDVSIANDLDLGSSGRLSGGATPSVINLTKMTASSNTFKGSGAAVLDLSASDHSLFIGCETPGYSGNFLAGSNSLVSYNRDNTISGSGGSQQILENLVYANLALSGSDAKITDASFTVTRNLNIDGSTTELSAITSGRTLTLGGNLTLSNDATMNDNCRDNLELITSGTLSQVFTGNNKTIKCFNLKSTKSAGGLVLTGPAGNTLANIKNDFALDYTGTALFEDQANTLTIGDDVELGSASSSFSHFAFTGTLVMDGDNAAVDLHISDFAGTGVAKARLNNLTIDCGDLSAPLNRLEVYPISGSATLEMSGNLIILNGTTGSEMDMNNNNLLIGGNWTSYDANAFKQGTATVTFNGSSSQTLLCTGGEVFNNLVLDNSASIGLLLNSQVTVENQMTFTNGKLDLNGNNLIIGTNLSNGSITGGHSGSYAITYDGAMNGDVIRSVVSPGVLFYPVGDFSSYSPITCTLNFASLSSATLSGRAVGGNHPNMGTSTNYIQRYWSLTPSGISNFNYHVSYSYAAGDAIGIEANLFPFKYNASGWLGAPGSGALHTMGSSSTTTPGTRTLTWNDLYTFSDFSAFGSGSPLPITLLDFHASEYNEQVKTEWTTLSEVNNDYFTVEKTIDGRNFMTVGSINGAGNSNARLDYVFFDENPLQGWSYYRLKQTDFDGNFSYSDLREVFFSGKPNTSKDKYLVASGPDGIKVKILFAHDDPSQIYLMDLQGRMIQNLNAQTSDGASYLLPADLLSSGCYILHVQHSTGSFNQRIVITK